MWYFVIGISSGFLLGVFLSSNKFIKNNLLRIVVAIIALTVFGLNAFATSNNISTSTQEYSDLIAFFSSIVFSWILAEFASAIQLKEREKDLAIRSFRHSRNLISKIQYSIMSSNSINEKTRVCGLNNGEDCMLSCNVNRIRDLLITFKKDANEIKNDWADVISDDIILYREIKEGNKQIEELRPKTQDEKYSYEEVTNFENEIVKLEKICKDKTRQLDNRVKLALEEQLKIDREIDDYIETENKFIVRRSQNIAPNKDVPIPDKQTFKKEA